jgi:hypothetical protein
MGLLNNAVKGTVLTGLAIGIGAAIFAPAVLPVLAGVDLWAEAKTEADAEMEEKGETMTLDQAEEVKTGGQTS